MVGLLLPQPRPAAFVARVYRDEPYLATLRDAVDGFLGELDELVEKVRRYGGAT